MGARRVRDAEDVGSTPITQTVRFSRCGPAWSGRMSGGHEIAGSNPVTATVDDNGLMV